LYTLNYHDGVVWLALTIGTRAVIVVIVVATTTWIIVVIIVVVARVVLTIVAIGVEHGDSPVILGDP
jgi:hypothetical protein